MGRPRKWKDPEKKQHALLFNKTLINKLKAYAVETDQTLEKIMKEPFERFENDLLELSKQIDEIRQNALITNTPTHVPVEPSIPEESLPLVTQ